MTATQWIVNAVETLLNSLWGFGTWLVAALIVLGGLFFLYLIVKTVVFIVKRAKAHKKSYKKTSAKSVSKKRGK